MVTKDSQLILGLSAESKRHKQTTRKHEGGTATSKHQLVMPTKEKYIRAMVVNRGVEAVVTKHLSVESPTYPQATR
jgi:hypothetical protein